MARRNSSKDLSERHENWIAKLFAGKRSRSSGAAVHEDGDVRCEDFLIECKMTGHPGKPPKKLPVFMQQFDKVAGEAWETGKTPMMAMRFYQPGHRLANAGGWIDVTFMLATDMADLSDHDKA